MLETGFVGPERVWTDPGPFGTEQTQITFGDLPQGLRVALEAGADSAAFAFLEREIAPTLGAGLEGANKMNQLE